MRYDITWWKGDHELPSILMLIGSDLKAARFHATKGSEYRDADKALIRDELGTLLEEIPYEPSKT